MAFNSSLCHYNAIKNQDKVYYAFYWFFSAKILLVFLKKESKWVVDYVVGEVDEEVVAD